MQSQKKYQKEGVRDKTNSRDASASKNANMIFDQGHGGHFPNSTPVTTGGGLVTPGAE